LEGAEEQVMVQAGQGLAAGTDARVAARRAATQAMAEAGGVAPDLVWVFATDGYDPVDVRAGVADVVGSTPIVGCRAPGVLARDRVTHDGVGVLALCGGIVSRIGVAPGVAADGRAAGATAAAQALESLEALVGEAQPDRTAIVVLPDAIRGNSCDVVRGVDAAVGAGLRLVGGGAGDNLQFKQTWQFAGDTVVDDAVLAIAMATPSPMGIALRHGCSPWGRPMKVTRVEGRTVHDLDWEPAFRRYAEVARELGADEIARDGFVSFAMLHPFGIPHGEEHYVLRSPLMLGEAGEIACCSDLPGDGVMRIMAGDRTSLLRAACEAGAAARTALLGARPAAALLFACVSRDFVVGGADDVSAEIQAVREGLGADVPIFGCLTFGQIGSLAGGAPQFHSKSVQVCALPARAA
jgi:hypothetical protein